MIRKAMKQRFDTVQSMINSAAEAIEKYSPTQARAPAGTERGGQWTSGGGGGSTRSLDPDKSTQVAMAESYGETALWSSPDELDSNYGISDIAAETRAKMNSDVVEFYEANFDAIFAWPTHMARGEAGRRGAAIRAGHDFWLTRNGHGAGFWDGDWPEPQATRLTAASEKFGSFDLYVGDDGLIHGS